MRSPRARLGAILLCFLLLVGGGTAAIAIALRARSGAALAADVAARQHVLAQTGAIEVSLLAGGLALLALGVWTAWRFALRPARDLSEAAARIGRGDPGTPVPPQDLREVATLAQSLESLRHQLEASQQALRASEDELEERVARRTRELVALYEVSREITSRLDIGHILRSVTEKARELLGADMAALCLIDEKGRALNLQSVSGPKDAVTKECLSMPDPFAEHVLASEQAVACRAQGCAGACGMLATQFRASHLATRLRVGDRAIGALCVSSQRAGAFTPDAASLLTRLGDSVAVALENARLYEQAEQLATLEERQRIASEMHDGAAQTLCLLESRAAEISALAEAGRAEEAAGVLSGVRDALAQASREMRQAIAALREPPAVRAPLHEQLGRLVRESEEDGEAGADVTSVLLPSPLCLPPEESEQVLRVVREALLNARRHARARRITVRLQQQKAEASVMVEDDGRGFDPKAPASDGAGHFGISIMRARAARLGGRLEVASAPGRGTRIRLCWPIAGADDAGSSAAPETR